MQRAGAEAVAETEAVAAQPARFHWPFEAATHSIALPRGEGGSCRGSWVSGRRSSQVHVKVAALLHFTRDKREGGGGGSGVPRGVFLKSNVATWQQKVGRGRGAGEGGQAAADAEDEKHSRRSWSGVVIASSTFMSRANVTRMRLPRSTLDGSWTFLTFVCAMFITASNFFYLPRTTFAHTLHWQKVYVDSLNNNAINWAIDFIEIELDL